MDKLISSTYRLQLNKDFNLCMAITALEYLAKLGVDAIYCSPIATSNSSHGYDIINPNLLNPTIGTEKEFDAFLEKLKSLDLKVIIDVVPNHMGIAGGNPWWEDVLEHGPDSKYASFFDIDWNSEKKELKGRVLLPILAEHYGTVLKQHEIKLHRDKNPPYLTYRDYYLPICPKTYSLIPKRVTFEGLDKLLEAQHYRLAYWKVAAHEINYRRFFNIHELAALRIEDQNVLKKHHEWIFDLVSSGKVQGLRIDHPDGLYDPVTYFKRLQENKPILTVVEKILDRKEELPSAWQVDGTVGYEYLNLLTGLFVRKKSEDAFTKIYEDFIGEKIDFEQHIYQSKKYFAEVEMVSEVEALGLALDRISEHDPQFRDFTRIDLTRALSEVIACFPVYRTYIAPEGRVSRRDARYITNALHRARAKDPNLDPSIFDFLEKVLLLKLPQKSRAYREFILHFQQLTGPLMAKGLEDTAFYRYNRFIALNEVGGDPEHFGTSIPDFHKFNQHKLQKWPYGLLASSTHDTKRSEDVRMRLAVLSEIPDRWQLEVKKWAMITQRFEKPSPNTEYFIYQTLLGAWPIELERLWEVVLKSIREAKLETSWSHPNEVYEKVVYDFLSQTLQLEVFLESFLSFQEEIDRLGRLNSLSAVTLKLGSCGICDLYQGNEHFTYRLVDPDNRVPVTFRTQHDEKERITQIGLNFRKQHPRLFLNGNYIQLRTKENLIAFARQHQEQLIIVTAARFYTHWKGGEVHVSKEWIGKTFRNLFSGHTIEIHEKAGHGYFYLPKSEPIGIYEECKDKA